MKKNFFEKKKIMEWRFLYDGEFKTSWNTLDVRGDRLESAEEQKTGGTRYIFDTDAIVEYNIKNPSIHRLYFCLVLTNIPAKINNITNSDLFNFWQKRSSCNVPIIIYNPDPNKNIDIPHVKTKKDLETQLKYFQQHWAMSFKQNWAMSFKQTVSSPPSTLTFQKPTTPLIEQQSSKKELQQLEQPSSKQELQQQPLSKPKKESEILQAPITTPQPTYLNTFINTLSSYIPKTVQQPQIVTKQKEEEKKSLSLGITKEKEQEIQEEQESLEEEEEAKRKKEQQELEEKKEKALQLEIAKKKQQEIDKKEKEKSAKEREEYQKEYAKKQAESLKASQANTFENLVKKSKEFEKNNRTYPIETNRIEILGKNDPNRQKQIENHAKEACYFIHEKVKQLILDFLNLKKEYGYSTEEREFYKQNFKDDDDDKKVLKFIERTQTKRPIVFYNADDTHRLRGNKITVVGFGFESIGTDLESHPLLLKGYMSYDEMAISAFVSVASPTFFINDGNRMNQGIPMKKGEFVEYGYYVGMIGARFEKEGYMEYAHMLVTKTQNTPENGYGNLDIKNITIKEVRKKKLLDMWAKFYDVKEGFFKTYDQIDKKQYTEIVDQNHSNAPFYLYNDVYKKRLYYILFGFLNYANEIAKNEKKKAYVFNVGLGLGVWQKSEKQANLMMDVYVQILKENYFEHISDLDFSWFQNVDQTKFESVKQSKNSKIAISFTTNDPAQIIKGAEDKIRIANYAWDSNAFVGNEYYLNMLYASGDPSAASCSTISEIQNPYVNPNLFPLTNSHLKIYPNSKLVFDATVWNQSYLKENFDKIFEGSDIQQFALTQLSNQKDLLEKKFKITNQIGINNSNLNRYPLQILPGDAHRYKFKNDQDQLYLPQHKDYINATWVNYLNTKENDETKWPFIATQSPLVKNNIFNEDTVDDFWAMVYETRADVIVSLCHKEEYNKKPEKCQPYWLKWDNDDDKFQLIDADEKNSVYKFELMPNSPKKHRVTQIRFQEWQDQNDVALEKLKKLINLYDKLKKNKTVPTIVHCSAGVGRTGTFLMCLIWRELLLKLTKEQKDLLKDEKVLLKNILASILQVRFVSGRIKLVQTTPQFELIKDYVSDLLKQ